MTLRERLSGLWLAPTALLIDRVSKRLITALPIGETVELVPGVIRLRRVRNPGMAFSMLSGMPDLLVPLTFLLLCGICLWLILGKSPRGKLFRAGLWIAAGGGFGNLIDRVLQGSVTDFIEPVFMRFAVFNLADVAVCVGVGLTALAILTEKE